MGYDASQLYMIFSPGTLAGFPTTYMTSFYLAEAQKNLLPPLLKKYPAVTVLEVDQILQQFRTILAQLTAAINLILYFALAAGFSVLFAAVYSTLDQRIYEGALLRTLGARRRFLRMAHLIEFGVLGLAAGLLATVAAESILYMLYTRVMQIDYQPHVYLWLALPAAGVAGVTLAATGECATWSGRRRYAYCAADRRIEVGLVGQINRTQPTIHSNRKPPQVRTCLR